MIGLWIGLGLLSIALSVVISSGIYFFGRVFVRADKTEATEQGAKARLERQGHPEIFPKILAGKEYFGSLNFEAVEIKSFDGLTLRGRYFKNPNPCGMTVVLSHGYKSYPDYDFGCVSKIYVERGCDLLVPWFRAHQKSDGKFTTMGAFEKQDLADWISWLDRRVSPDEKIVVAGMSLGSTVSLLVAANPNVSDKLCGVIADCGFVSIREEIRNVLKSVGFPTFPIVWSGGIVSRLRLGVSLDDFSTVKEVPNIRVPILFIHGQADTFVPPDSTERNFAAATAPKKLVWVKDAQHCYAYHTDEELVGGNIKEFLGSL